MNYFVKFKPTDAVEVNEIASLLVWLGCRGTIIQPHWDPAQGTVLALLKECPDDTPPVPGQLIIIHLALRRLVVRNFRPASKPTDTQDLTQPGREET